MAGEGDRGSYTVRGLGKRKKALLKEGGTVLDMAVAMLETENMRANYVYGDGKKLDSANFGIFKQNWMMIRASYPGYAQYGAADYDIGAALNGDLHLDVAILHLSQAHYGLDTWFAGHRNGASGLRTPNTPDITAYRTAVYWIRDQLNGRDQYRSDDTRFWVQVHAI
jgi:hypothetical protein